MKKIIHRFLPLVAAMLLAPMSSWAYSFTGDGHSAGDPFVIDTEAELIEFANAQNAGEFADYHYAYGEVYVKLGANITITSPFTPIGKYSEYPFKGHFDGNGMTIGGAIDRDGDYSGLFGYVGKGEDAQMPEIKDLIIEGLTVTTTGSNAGILAGSVDKGTITNIQVKNSSVSTSGSSKKNFGGLIGVMTSGSITGCTLDNVTVDGGTNYNVGAILGNKGVGTSMSMNSYDVQTTIKYGGGAAINYWNTRKADVAVMLTNTPDAKPGIAIGNENVGGLKPYDIGTDGTDYRAMYKTTTLTVNVTGTYTYCFGNEVIPAWTAITIKDESVTIPHAVYAGSEPTTLAQFQDKANDVTTFIEWDPASPASAGDVEGTVYLRNGDQIAKAVLYTIDKFDISSATVTINPTEFTYNGEAQYPSTVTATVTDCKSASQTLDLSNTADYEITYKINGGAAIAQSAIIPVGAYRVVITAKAGSANFKGTVDSPVFTIKKLTLHQNTAGTAGYVTFADIAPYTYSNAQKKPTPGITYIVKPAEGTNPAKTETLAAGDMTFSYVNNINAWEAANEQDDTENNKPTVKVETITLANPNVELPASPTKLQTNFRILRRQLTDDGVAFDYKHETMGAFTDYEYDGENAGQDDVSGFDYTSADAVRFIQGHGGLLDSDPVVSYNMTITTDYLYSWYGLDANSNGQWDDAEKTSGNGSEIRNVLYDGDNVVSYTLVITGVNNFKGTHQITRKINPRSLSYGPTVDITPAVYNTQEQQATQFSNWKNDMGNNMAISTTNPYSTGDHNNDFWVSERQPGTNAGNYNVTITASPHGNYTGSYTFSGGFVIVKKKLDNSDNINYVNHEGTIAYLFKKPDAYNASNVPVYKYTGSPIEAYLNIQFNYNWKNGTAQGVAAAGSGAGITNIDAELAINNSISQDLQYAYYSDQNCTTPVAPADVKNAGEYWVKITPGAGVSNYEGEKVMKFIIEPQHINSKYIKVAFVDPTDAANEIQTKGFISGLTYNNQYQDPQLHVWYDENNNNKKDGSEYELILGTDYDITYTDWRNNNSFDGINGNKWPKHARRVDVMLKGKGNWDNVNDPTAPALEDQNSDDANYATTKLHGSYYYDAAHTTLAKPVETVTANLLTVQNVASGIHYWIDPRDLADVKIGDMFQQLMDPNKIPLGVKVENNPADDMNPTATTKWVYYQGGPIYLGSSDMTDTNISGQILRNTSHGDDRDVIGNNEPDARDGGIIQNVKRDPATDAVLSYNTWFENTGNGNYKGRLNMYFRIMPVHIGGTEDSYTKDDLAAGITYTPGSVIDQQFTGKYIVDQVANTNLYDNDITDDVATPEDERKVAATNDNTSIWVNNYSVTPYTHYDPIEIKHTSLGTLTRGTDYTVTFEDSKKAGTAKVKIKGIGNYDYTFRKEFEIVKMKIYGIDIVNVEPPHVGVLLDRQADEKIVILYGRNEEGKLYRLDKEPFKAHADVKTLSWVNSLAENRTGWKALPNETYTVSAYLELDGPTAASYEFVDPFDMPYIRINSREVKDQLHIVDRATLNYEFAKTPADLATQFNHQTRRLTISGEKGTDLVPVTTNVEFWLNNDDPADYTPGEPDGIQLVLQEAMADNTGEDGAEKTGFFAYEIDPFVVNTNLTSRIVKYRPFADFEAKYVAGQYEISKVKEVAIGADKTSKWFIAAAPAVGQKGNLLYSEPVDALSELATMPDAIIPTAQIGDLAGHNTTANGGKIFYIKTTADTEADAYQAEKELLAAVDWHLGNNKLVQATKGTDNYTLGSTDAAGQIEDLGWKEYTAAIDLTADDAHKYVTYYFVSLDNTGLYEHGFSPITKYRAEHMLELNAVKEWMTYFHEKKYTDYDGVTEKDVEGFKVIGADVYNVTAADANAATLTVSDVQTMVPTKQPVLLHTKADNGKIYLSSLRYDAAEWTATTTATEFTGAEAETQPDFTQYDYFVLNEGEFVKVNNHDTSKIGANKSWLQFAAGSYPALARLRFAFDEADAIDAAMVETMQQGDWYDLNGRKLDNAPVRKGLYIFNGRKVVIK